MDSKIKLLMRDFEVTPRVAVMVRDLLSENSGCSAVGLGDLTLATLSKLQDQFTLSKANDPTALHHGKCRTQNF